MVSDSVVTVYRFYFIMAYHSTNAIMGYAQPQPFTPTISLHGLTIKVFLHTRPIVRKVKFIADSKKLSYIKKRGIASDAPFLEVKSMSPLLDESPFVGKS